MTSVLPLDFSSGAHLCSGPPAAEASTSSWFLRLLWRLPLSPSGADVTLVPLFSFVLSSLVLTVITTLSKNLQWLPTDSLLDKSHTPWSGDQALNSLGPDSPTLIISFHIPFKFQALVKPNHSQLYRHCAHPSLHAFAHTDSSTSNTPTRPAHPPSYFSPQISAPASALLCLVPTTSLGGIRNRPQCLSALCTQSFHAAPHRHCILGFTHQPPLLDQELPEAHPCSFIPNTNTKIRPNITLSKHMVNG